MLVILPFSTPLFPFKSIQTAVPHLSSLSINGFITSPSEGSTDALPTEVPSEVLPNNFQLPSLSITTIQLLSRPTNTKHQSPIFFQTISSICHFHHAVISTLPTRLIHHLSRLSTDHPSHQHQSMHPSILFHHTINSLFMPTQSNYHFFPTPTMDHFH